MGWLESLLNRFRREPTSPPPAAASDRADRVAAPAPSVRIEVVREPSRSGNTPVEPPKFQPPSRKQRALCERLGLEIRGELSRKEVGALIGEALKRPEIHAIYDAMQAEEAAELEREERAEFGDALYDEWQRWEKLCGPKQYLARFKRGKSIHVDVIEFDFVDLDPKRAAGPLRIGLLLPRRKPDRVGGPYLEWDKEVLLAPNQILSFEPLAQEIDLYDLERYEQVVGAARSSGLPVDRLEEGEDAPR